MGPNTLLYHQNIPFVTVLNTASASTAFSHREGSKVTQLNAEGQETLTER